MINPQMNANERKYYFGDFTKNGAVSQVLNASSVSFLKNNINYSRLFAFICGK